MSSRCNNARESLVRDGADVDQGQVVSRQSGMDRIQSDTTLDDGIILFRVDLG